MHSQVSESDEVPKKGGLGKVVLVLLLLVVAGGVAAAALYPLPYVVKGTYELQPKNSLNVEVAREGVVGSVAVKEGDWVESGALIFSYDTEAAKKKLADAEKKVAELQKKAEKSGPGKKAGDARKKLDKAQGDLKEEQADLEKAKAKGKKAAITKQEKKVKKAEAAVAKAQRALDAAQAALGGEAKGDLDKAVAERDALRGQTEASPFNAPVAGFVRELKVKAGDEAKVGAAVCLLDDTKQLTVKMAAAKGETLSEGQKASLELGGKKVDVKVEKIINGEGRGTLDNAKGEHKPGEKGALSIDGGGRPLLKKYL
jgi:multidrug efflux pump subunit AcrA (membrane-fusion protein)